MDRLFSPNSRTGLRRTQPQEGPPRLLVRLVLGLIQGALLYGLYRTTKLDDINTGFLAAWALVAAYAAPVGLAAIGQISLRASLVWTGIATAILAAIGLSSGLLPDNDNVFLVMAICLPAALFCAHHLIIPSLRSGQAFAPYDQYYETAWKAGIQLVLALMFLGVFWLILWLGAALFNAIGIDFVGDLISEEWFVFFASSLLFALGFELSDVRDGLTQGIRTVALTLLSWLLPVAVFLAAAFLITLPLAGLSELHTSLSPSGLMLAASAGLIILINTAYQDGGEHLTGTAFLRMTLRVGCVLLLPMTLFALWAVSVRIGQHGLTVSRIVAITAAVIGLIYAIGYVLAQFMGRNRSGGWLPWLEGTNVVAAIITTATLIGYSTPWLNPQQLSINSQLARLESGKLTADAIPYSWLGWQAGPRGRAALEELAKSKDSAIATKAKAALENRYVEPVAYTPSVTMLPEGTALPEGFAEALKTSQFGYECPQNDPCTARLYDFDADGTEDILLAVYGQIRVYSRDTEGSWAHKGSFTRRDSCGIMQPKNALKDNAPKAGLPNSIQPIELGEHVLDFAPEKVCQP